MSRLFYQSHSCEGFSAKVTIEWDIPGTTDEIIIKNRIAAAEDIADDILRFSGSKMRDMVQAMRGIKRPKPDYMLRGGPGRDFRCEIPNVIECARSECQAGQRCQRITP